MGHEILIHTINLAVILNILFSLLMFERNNGRTIIVYRRFVSSIASYTVSLVPVFSLVYMLYSVAYKF